MADAPCLTAAGQDVCVVSTLTCTTSNDSTPAGSNCPQSTARNVLFTQEMDLNLNQPGIAAGILTIPPGYAPGMAMAPDVLVSGAQCNFPADDPLASQPCPQSIMTSLEDATIRGGGTGTTTNSSYVLFCCEPEWHTTPTVPLWSNGTTVPVAFSSAPPATPVPDDNNFHAAQGASVVFGAEPRGIALDTTYPLPAEQTLGNPLHVSRPRPVAHALVNPNPANIQCEWAGQYVRQRRYKQSISGRGLRSALLLGRLRRLRGVGLPSDARYPHWHTRAKRGYLQDGTLQHRYH